MIETMIKETRQEASETKDMLGRVPADKFDWKPHEKSSSLKGLATHIAVLNGMTGQAIINDDYLDLSTIEAPEISSTKDIIEVMENGSKASLDALNDANEEDLDQPFELRWKSDVLMSMPKGEFIRKMGMNHIYHHRAQLGVYLRLLDVPIPGVYGKSADEKDEG